MFSGITFLKQVDHCTFCLGKAKIIAKVWKMVEITKLSTFTLEMASRKQEIFH